MRKILILIVCILFSASVFAGIVVKPFGGYTSVSNPSGNRILDMLLLSWSIPPEVKYKKTYFHDAYVVGVDVGYALIPGLDIGLRGEYIGCYGEVKAWNTVWPNETESFEFPAGTLPVLAGFSYTYEISGSPFFIGADVYAGYGFANMTLVAKNSNYDGLAVATDTAPCYGGGFVIDSALKLGYRLSDMLTLTLNTGYRQAKVEQFRSVKDTTAVGMFSFEKNEVIIGPAGKAIMMDYSGLILNIALSIKL